LQSYALVQVLLFIYLSFGSLTILIILKPFEEKLSYYVELFNEVLIFMSGLAAMFLVDTESQPGSVMLISIIVCTMTFNVGVIIYESVTIIRNKCSKKKKINQKDD
jgi:hypothetical protein